MTTHLAFAARVLMLACAISFTTGCPSGDDDDVPDGPHALGVITIGEVHASSGGTSSASVVAGFVPDAAEVAPTCTRQVAGCELPDPPDCGGPCGANEACAHDSGCQSVCRRICDAQCGAGEECYFATFDSPACRPRQTFDAGTITLTGTTTPVTLFPPYGFAGVEEGSLFLDGAELIATATGANTAGLAGFEQAFTATRLLRTQPPLHQLGLLQVFGTGDIPIQWIAGDDEVRITATITPTAGATRVITCTAVDGDGRYDLPRAAIDAVLDGAGLDDISIAVTRHKSKMAYDLATLGELAGRLVQPTSWLEVSTTSTESAAFAGCDGDEQLCTDACVDTSYDNANCGGCGDACAASDFCQQSTCSGPAACDSCVNTVSSGNGTCAASYNACTNDAACQALRTCLNACPTNECVQTCFADHPEGQAGYSAWVDCICNVGCDPECQDACF